MKQCFYFTKVDVEILLELKKNGKKMYGTLIAKKINCTYAYNHKRLNFLRDLNIIESFYEGRRRYIQLTEKGKKLANNLYEIDKIMNNEKEIRK